MKLIGFDTSGESTDEARADDRVFGLVKRYDKKRAAGGKAGHQGRLSGVYRNAIEINGGSLIAAGGFTTAYGLICGLVGVYFLRHSIYETFEMGYYPLTLLGLLVPFCVFFIGIYFEMFGPSESPIYFDRARRKVYYVHRSGRRRFILFGASTVEARVIDWSLVDAEHHTKARASTASVSRDHYLVFLMRKSTTDPTIVDAYPIGPVDFPSALWEYIRRYMERDAAPLIAGEAPPYKGAIFDMVEALKQRKKNYWQDWREFPWTQLWQHLALPLFAVFFIVNRFVVLTAQKVSWPQEVVDALGTAITEEDLKADPTHRLRPESGRAKDSI
ncbi:DUF6708 domain-containing protein [Variovorax paradoxus]|uniref:DUF6708 domain-containing protein n=1 Tax=Variovorax paradoxus (strain EPS) TaxID=595537 RepID=E6VA87_VARPE|nr:DUF6708 domain-containing protein [Variovorax paradoxus]ADU38559.1 hypothetical protein Varpa_4391 [Variovorax paradoxus EPS]